MSSKGSRTRHSIIEHALQLFSVKGYFNTSVSDLLEATKLTKGGLYGHFSSKEEIWYAVYDEAVIRWRGIVFQGTREIDNPLTRIERVILNGLYEYLGKEVFVGGCFFLNSLVELSGQSEPMKRKILGGFVRYARLLETWLQEAEEKGLIAKGLDHREIADFLVIAVNGAASLYSAIREQIILDQTASQIRRYLQQLKHPV